MNLKIINTFNKEKSIKDMNNKKYTLKPNETLELIVDNLEFNNNTYNFIYELLFKGFEVIETNMVLN